MTVTYTANVATCRGFGCFLKLLFRWRGSIYKLVWLDLLCFLFIYYLLNIVYRTALNDEQKVVFESIVKYCKDYSDQIPLSFVLGFYVSIVMTRWWNQYTSIPWPDSLAVFVSANIHGQDERGRLMRRTIMRYVCLCLTMVLTNVSPRVKKRFPTLQHLVDAGLMVENEMNVMDQFNTRFNSYSKHWMPIVWAASIVTRARKEGLIRDDFGVKTIIDELNNFRAKTGTLIMYDTISVPLVYTQVVTLAVYTYFLTAVMAQQWTETKLAEDKNVIDMYFPIFTTLQFFFYMGWLKVAESLINPFGEDDDDFEVNWMIDRNLQVAYMIVDEMHHNHPQLVRDQYWDLVFPVELPYTQETKPFREKHPEPSTANIEIPKSSMTNVKMEDMVGKSGYSVNYKFPEHDDEEANNDDAVSGIHFTTGGNSHARKGSSASLSSGYAGGSMPRVNSVVNSFKRLFSRSDSQQPPGGFPLTPDVAQQIRLPGSASTNSLAGQTKYPTLKIADQVIEEVDEQMTITSMRGADPRPTAASLFAVAPPLPASKPMEVPATAAASGNHHYRSDDYQRTQSFVESDDDEKARHRRSDPDAAYLSTSAPVAAGRPLSTARKSTGGGDGFEFTIEDFDQATPTTLTPTGGGNSKPNTPDAGSGPLRMGPEEHFEKLRRAREKDRQNRFLARSISAQQQQAGEPNAEGISGSSPNTESLLDRMSVRNAGLSGSVEDSRSGASQPKTTNDTTPL